MSLCSSLHLLPSPSHPPPLLLLHPPQPVGCDDALTAWRLFLEVPAILWRSGGGWSRNSGGVVVRGVGVEISGRAAMLLRTVRF